MTEESDAAPHDSVVVLHSAYHGLCKSRVAVTFTLAGAIAALCCAWLSDGVHHDDDLQHLQLARWAAQRPEFLLDEWGRPGFTVLYALPAQLGWMFARAFTVGLSALTAWLTYRIARRVGLRFAEFAPALFWLQPAVFTTSLTTLTEPVMALYWTAAFWFFIRGAFVRSALLASLCAVTRHEAILILPVWWAAMLLRGRPLREWIWLIFAPGLYNLLAWLTIAQTPAQMFAVVQPTQEYGSGGWLAMLARWAMAAGPAQLALALGSGVWLWRRGSARLWMLTGALYFLAHSILFRFGLFASGGYERFLMPVGPLVAVAALLMVQELVQQVRRAPLVAVGVALAALWAAAELEIWAAFRDSLWIVRIAAGLLFSSVAGAWYASRQEREPNNPVGFGGMSCALRRVPTLLLIGGVIAQPVISANLDDANRRFVPLRLDEDQIALQAAVAHLAKLGLDGRPLIAANPWVYEFAGTMPAYHGRFSLAHLEELAPGGVFVWESRYAPSPSFQLAPADLARRGDLVEVWRSAAADRGLACIIFEKVAVAQPAIVTAPQPLTTPETP